jgi:hypothetical protein
MLFVPLAGFVKAQTSNGTLVGTVEDPSGAALAGATVSILSVDTGAVKTATSLDNGSYRIEAILPATYIVTVKAANFQSTVVKGVYIAGSIITTRDVILKLGSAAEQVEVVANAVAVNTDNAQISGHISSEEIQSLPFSSYNPYSLALTLPGVTNTQQGAFSNGVNFTVGGGRPRTNNFLIEGQDNNDAGLHGQGFQPENVEAQKEVVIIQNNYTSEYGHGAGSVSNLIFKSGTNQFHGSVYERHENSALDSANHYDIRNGIDKSIYRENLFGFTIGGPIIRNKVFAFGSYQWDKYRSTASLGTLTVPSAAGYAKLNSLPTNTRITNLIAAYGGLVGDHAKLVAAGGVNSIALGFDPANPTVDRGYVELGNVTRSLGNSSEAPELDLKGDYLIGANDTMTLRYIKSNYKTPFDVNNFPSQLPGFDSDQNGVAQNAGITETHIFTPTLLNEFRLSYGRIGFIFGLPASTTSNALFGKPGVSIDSMTGYGISTAIPQGRFHNTYQVQDTVTWTRGKHTMKFGADIADVRVRDAIPFNFYGTISYVSVPSVYTGLANYIDDFGGANGTISQNFGSPTARPRMVSQNYFAQDTWKATQNLSFDYGIRYEYNGAPFNTTGTPYPGLDLNNPACFPSATVTCNLKQTPDTKDWGPRVGVAYSPTWWSNYVTVVRGGVGMFYDGLFTNIIDNTQASAPNNSAKSIISAVTTENPRGTPNWMSYTDFTGVTKTPLATDTAQPILDHLLSPKTFHWNLNVQQELPGGFVAQVSYVGERGEHLYGQTEFNPKLNSWVSTARRIPTRGRIVLRDNSEDSNYNGMWAQVDKKMSSHLMFRAAYTWARGMDDGSEIFTTNNQSAYASASYPANRKVTDYGPSAYDIRQRLVFSYVISPPMWHTEGAMKVLGNVVNHWSVAGITQFQSGIPENVEVGSATQSLDVNGDGISNDRPILSNPKAPMSTYAFDDSWWYFDGTSHGQYCSGPSYWNTSMDCQVVSPSSVHWIVPAYGTRPATTVGRNSLYGPGLQLWDMNIQRSFKIWHESTLDIRGEFYNIFNHGNANDTDYNASVENTSLVTGILTDAYSNSGSNNFHDPTNTVDGHRSARIFIRIAF